MKSSISVTSEVELSVRSGEMDLCIGQRNFIPWISLRLYRSLTGNLRRSAPG